MELYRKNNIDLSKYDFQRDIDCRLLMAEFSLLDVEVLREIIDGSLKVNVGQLANILKITPSKLSPILEKLGKTGLISQQGDTIHVNKEMRKYYESQMLKFDDQFEPDMEFIQGLLSKVPIHELLNWYQIPRTSDHIFTSIVDNYFRTPKIYEAYLTALRLDSPIMEAIKNEVLSTPDFEMPAQKILDKFSLEREEFEKIMLHLEFNFVCFLGYHHAGDRWEEVVMPFHEWRTYLCYQRDNKPKSIKDFASIKRIHAQDFGFIHDMRELLESAHEEEVHLDLADPYVGRFHQAMSGLELAKFDNGRLKPTAKAREWLIKPIHDQAISVYHDALRRLRVQINGRYSERDIGEIERSLRRITKLGWIYLDEFLMGATPAIGTNEPITLKNQGKKWHYNLPEYSDQDLALIEAILFEPLFEAGKVAVGTHKGRTCFAVTPFGARLLGD